MSLLHIKFCFVYKLLGVETEHEAANKDVSTLRRQLVEVEEDWRAKERNYLLSLDEAKETECQLSDERRQLVRTVDEAGTELIETRLRLSAADGHVTALEHQLKQVSTWHLTVYGDVDD